MTRGATWPASDFLTLVAKFRDERDWARFHSSKDLALSVSIEAAELLECFQWSGDDLEAPERSAEIEAEMADVLIYLAMLADHRGVDLDRAVRAKLAAAARKYPATAVKGEASAARAAARAIHEETRRTGANVPATAPSNTEEKKENASLPETVETCVAGDAKAAVRTSVPEEKTPAQDAQEVRKPDAPVVALKEEKTAVPIPPPPSEDPRRFAVVRRRCATRSQDSKSISKRIPRAFGRLLPTTALPTCATSSRCSPSGVSRAIGSAPRRSAVRRSIPISTTGTT